MKRSDIKENKIIIKKLNKTYNEGIINLDKYQMELLTKFESKSDYLLNLGKVKDRNKKFCETIPILSIEYFRVRLTSTDFRKVVETYEQGLLEHLPQKERIEKAKESARLRDHTLAVAQSHYIQETDTIRIDSKIKKTLEIIGNDNIVRTVNLEDLVKILDFLQIKSSLNL